MHTQHQVCMHVFIFVYPPAPWPSPASRGGRSPPRGTCCCCYYPVVVGKKPALCCVGVGRLGGWVCCCCCYPILVGKKSALCCVGVVLGGWVYLSVGLSIRSLHPSIHPISNQITFHIHTALRHRLLTGRAPARTRDPPSARRGSCRPARPSGGSRCLGMNGV